MIVYDDPVIRAPLGHVFSRLEHPGPYDLEDLRTRLIVAGQIEQGLQDRQHADADRFSVVTDRCADAFVRGVLDRKWEPPKIDSDFDEEVLLDLKVPEGYQSYGVYPEQYIYAAEQALSQPFRHAVVIGIRSIGTSLSAAVAATLRHHGREVERLTVRPTGDPYNRVADLPRLCGEIVFVVDEGPGQSGSSFASVQKALLQQGFRPDQIVFMPSHTSRPGQAASEEVRAIWESTACLTYDMRSEVEAALLSASQLYFGTPDTGIVPADSSVLGERPVYAPFEPARYLATSKGGRVLWSFYGLNSSYAGETYAWNDLAALHHYGQGSEILETRALGYVGVVLDEWQPATSVSVDEVLRYLKLRAPTHYVDTESEESYERLRHMAYWNVHKSFGAERADRVNAIAPANPPDTEGSYADGRMMLYNWVRDSSGRLLKLDAAGHPRDNTVIGTQSILWDVAGAIIELGVDENELLEKCHLEPFQAHMPFYRVAYCAFWMGMARMSADIMGTDDLRTAALEAEFLRYRAELGQLLG